MSTEMQSVRDLIAKWPTRRDLVQDMDAQGFDVTVDRVHKWAQHNAIPAKYHLGILVAASARGFSVSADDLAGIHHAPDRKLQPGVSLYPETNCEFSHVQSKDTNAA